MRTVGRAAAAERVGGAIEAEMLGFEASAGGQVAAEALLAVGGKDAGQWIGGTGLGLDGLGARECIAEPGFVTVEDRLYIGGADAALKAVHQAVVGRELQGWREGGGSLGG